MTEYDKPLQRNTKEYEEAREARRAAGDRERAQPDAGEQDEKRDDTPDE